MQVAWKRPVKDVLAEVICYVINKSSCSATRAQSLGQFRTFATETEHILPCPRKVLLFLGVVFLEFVKKIFQIFHQVRLEIEHCMCAKPSL